MIHKRMRIIFLMVFVFLIVQASSITPQGQTQQVQRKPLTLTQSGRPTIIMQRVALESPANMKIYETQALMLPTNVIQKFIVEKNILKTPVAIRYQTHDMENYIDNERKFTRLLTDKLRGHMLLLPNLEKMAVAKIQLLNGNLALNKAQEHLNALQLIPQDDSRIMAHNVITLNKAEVRQGQPAVSSPVLQTVFFRRTLNEKPVFGRGSQLFLELGHQGELVGLHRNWNKLMPSALRPEFRTDNEVYTDIERTILTQLQGAVTVQVNRPELIYYGNDQRFVQPAYQFTAEITGPGAVAKEYFIGVVPALRNAPEPVTMLKDSRTRTLPLTVPAAGASPAASGFPPAADDPTVGRYVVRDDSWDWVDDACDFKNGLNAGHPSSWTPITFGDYYWDYPRLWTTQENSFVDRWHITLMEGHGAPWLFTTRSNCCDVVNFNTASQPGYGNRPGDSMRYLILKSCSVVPALPDRANWADPWWRVFKGLHQAIGFRTTMYINDDISYDFGWHLAQNCRVLDSWFHATNTCSGYHGSNGFGFGAVVMIPGHEGDTIYSTAPLPPATSTGLTIWWQY